MKSSYGTNIVLDKGTFCYICRYMEIIHSLWHRAYFTKKAAYISIALVWTIGFLIVSTYHLPTTKVIITFGVQVTDD